MFNREDLFQRIDRFLYAAKNSEGSFPLGGHYVMSVSKDKADVFFMRRHVGTVKRDKILSQDETYEIRTLILDHVNEEDPTGTWRLDEDPPERTGYHIVETSDCQQKIALYIAEDDPDDFCGWNIFEDVVRWWPLPVDFEPRGEF